MHTLIPVSDNAEDLFGEFIVLLKMHKLQPKHAQLHLHYGARLFIQTKRKQSLNTKPDFIY